MTTLLTVESVSRGGRCGTIATPPGSKPVVTLGTPREPGGRARGPGPELILFAGAYSVCFHGALLNAVGSLGAVIEESTVRALVSLIEDERGDYRLSVELRANLPGVQREHAQRMMEAAHVTCPYSRVLEGESAVTLVVD